MKVLMVGAGAVGQVFALHLSQAGAQVTFLVKARHPLPAVLPLFPASGRPKTLAGFRRFTSVKEVAAERWDQVWLAVPSNALAGAWLEEVLAATRAATVVALAPESERRVPPERRVLGAIPFVAWQQPLPGETGAPGVAYWIPPLSRVPLSGPAELVAPVRALLEAGGLKAKPVRDVAKTGAPVTALLICLVAALERAGWSLRAFHGQWARLAASSAREALSISSPSSLARLAARGWVLSAVLKVAARVVPFHLERYLRYHFTKVGEQTRGLLHAWVEEGRRRHLPTGALQALAKGLTPSSPPQNV